MGQREKFTKETKNILRKMKIETAHQHATKTDLGKEVYGHKA